MNRVKRTKPSDRYMAQMLEWLNSLGLPPTQQGFFVEIPEEEGMVCYRCSQKLPR